MTQGHDPAADHDGLSSGSQSSAANNAAVPSSEAVGSFHLPPLTVLKGRYLVQNVLGEGGFGITYDGVDQLLGNRVAIKEYFPKGHVVRDVSHSLEVVDVTVGSETSFTRGLERFRDEARIMARVGKAPALCGIVDFFEEFGTAYIVMEFVEGMSLGAHLDANGGTMEFHELMELIVPIVRALGLMHEAGLVHRDVSPDNIMVGPNGAILIDYGCAREFIVDESQKQTMTVMLKYDYAAPEQYGGTGQGPWTDVYGICAVIYRALTGVAPPRVPDRLAGCELASPRSLAPGIPVHAERAIKKGLSLDARERPQTMAELESMLSDGRRRRPPVVPVVAALMVAIAAAVTGILVWYPSDDGSSDSIAREISQEVGETGEGKVPETVTDEAEASSSAGESAEETKDVVSYSLTGALSAGGNHTVAIVGGDAVKACGSDTYGQCSSIRKLKDIVQVAAGIYHTAELRSNGRVVACGDNSFGQCATDDWRDVVAVSCGVGHTVGLTADGRVLAVGSDEYGQCKVTSWEDVTAVSAGFTHTLGLTADGSVMAVGESQDGELDVGSWRDVIGVAAGCMFSVGLKSDGTVLVVGNNSYDQLDASGWEDVTEISAGAFHVVGLTEDGHVVAAGDNENGQCDVEEWSDVVHVSAGAYHTVAVCRDGTVLATGLDDDGQCDVSDWKVTVEDDADAKKA